MTQMRWDTQVIHDPLNSLEMAQRLLFRMMNLRKILIRVAIYFTIIIISTTMEISETTCRTHPWQDISLNLILERSKERVIDLSMTILIILWSLSYQFWLRVLIIESKNQDRIQAAVVNVTLLPNQTKT